MNDSQPSIISLAVLGTFSLSGPDGPVAVTGKKVAALLTFLACTQPVAQGREKLCNLLWDGQSEDLARQNLRQVMTGLRRVIGAHGLITAGSTVRLAPGYIASDVSRFEQLARSHHDRDALAQAVDLYRDRLLSDVTLDEAAWQDWLLPERTRLEALAVDAMINLGALELALGNAAKALALSERAIALTDFREDAHRLKMGALASASRRADALRHYDQLERRIADELDTTPDAATTALAADLRNAPSARSDAAHGDTMEDTAASTTHEATLTATHDPIATGIIVEPPVSSGSAIASGPPAPTVRASARPTKPHGVFDQLRTMTTAMMHGDRKLIIAIAGLAVAIFVGVSIKNRGMARSSAVAVMTTPETAYGHIASVAVLPVSSTTAEHQTLLPTSQVLADAVVRHLARVSMIRVVSALPETSAALLPTTMLTQVAAKYQVRHVLAIAVRNGGDKMLINVDLIDTRTGHYAWSRTVSEDAQTWPTRQDFVARRASFAAQMELVRRAGSAPMPTDRPPSVEKLLAKGWAGQLDGTASPRFEGSMAAFTEALTRDPESTYAMVGLASYYLTGIGDLTIAREPHLTEAEILLRHALAITPQNFIVHYNLGIFYNLQGNIVAAIDAFDRAIELNPSHAPSYARKGRALLRIKRYDVALRIIQEAQELNGDTLPTGWDLWAGWAELELGHDEAARRLFDKAVARMPNSPYANASLAAWHALAGDMAQAKTFIAVARARTPKLSDQQRLIEFNKAPDARPLDNRLGKGLILALALPH